MTYLIVFLLLLLFIFKDSNKQKDRLWFVIATTIVLIFFSGFRNVWIGNDTYAYINSLERSQFTSWSELWTTFLPRYLTPNMDIGKDPGYYVFEKIVSFITTDSTVFLCIIAFFTITPISIFIYFNTRDTSQIFFVYLYYVVMFFGYIPNSAIRQSIAIGIIHLAYLFLQKEKMLTFCILTLLASTMHRSSLVCILFGLIVKYINIKHIEIISILGFIIVLLMGPNINDYLGVVGGFYDEYESDYYMMANKSRPFMVIVLIGLLYVITIMPNFSQELKEKNKIFLIACSAMVFIVPLVRVNPSYIRTSAYFGMFFAIYVAQSLRIVNKQYQWIYALIISIFIIKGIMDDSYKFNWQYMKVNERYAKAPIFFTPNSTLIPYTNVC